MSSFIFTSCKNDETKKDIHSSIDNNKKNEVINESNNIRTDSNNLIGVWNWRSDDKSQAFTIKIKKLIKILYLDSIVQFIIMVIKLTVMLMI